MTRKYNKLLCIFILPLILTGCWDYKDINNRTIGITTGIDISKDGTESIGEKVKLWAGSQGEGSSSSNSIEVYKFKGIGITFENMKKNYETQIPELNFDQSAIALIVGKNYAEKIGIESYMNRAYYSQGLRSSIHVTVSEDALDDLFSKKVDNAISIGYGIEETLRYLNHEGKTMVKSVQEIQSDSRFGNIGYLIPYITVSNNTVKYLGFAVMVNSKMVDIIKYEESNGFLLLLSKKAVDTRAFSSPNDYKNLLSITSSLKKRSIKTSYENNKINIYIDLKLKSVIDYEYHIEPLSNSDIKKLQGTIKSKLNEDVLTAINRSRNEFKSDVFGFARYFKAQNSEIYKTINWSDEYPNAVFHVKVNTTITSTGLLDPNAEKPK